MREFPAVYDFAASQNFQPADIPDKAVFYLNGQRTGFVLMNTEKECSEHSKRLSPVFDDAGRGRMWIVVGYSGLCDPVFDHLAKVDRFDQGLFWIGYKDEEPSAHLRKQLLLEGKFAFYVKGFDADSFFITLCQKLECFPPKFIDRPFEHLYECVDMLTPFPLPGEDYRKDVKLDALEKIGLAIKRFDCPNSDGSVPLV